MITSIFSFFCNVFKTSTNTLDSLTINKILDWSKLKASTDNKIIMTHKLKFVLGRAENIVGKGENAGYQRVQSGSLVKCLT